jgi:hypothetical protein
MEHIEEEKVTPVPPINEGLFSLCDDFDEHAEEFKDTPQGVDDRLLYMNYKA